MEYQKDPDVAFSGEGHTYKEAARNHELERLPGKLYRRISEDNSDISLRDKIQNIAIEFPGYDYIRITVELRNRGHLANSKKVRRLMKEDNHAKDLLP